MEGVLVCVSVFVGVAVGLKERVVVGVSAGVEVSVVVVVNVPD